MRALTFDSSPASRRIDELPDRARRTQTDEYHWAALNARVRVAVLLPERGDGVWLGVTRSSSSGGRIGGNSPKSNPKRLGNGRALIFAG
jgi:hypothetical protein